MWGLFLLLKPDIILSVPDHQSQAQQEVWYEDSWPDVQILPNPGRICHLNVAPKIWQMFSNSCWKVQGYDKEYKGLFSVHWFKFNLFWFFVQTTKGFQVIHPCQTWNTSATFRLTETDFVADIYIPLSYLSVQSSQRFCRIYFHQLLFYCSL